MQEKIRGRQGTYLCLLFEGDKGTSPVSPVSTLPLSPPCPLLIFVGVEFIMKQLSDDICKTKVSVDLAMISMQ